MAEQPVPPPARPGSRAHLQALDAAVGSRPELTGSRSANKPGVVVIGQDDSGKPTGLAVTDVLLLELADLRTNSGIVPFPQISVRQLDLDGTSVAVIVVEPAQSPPLRYRGRTYIRVGPSTRPATAAEESMLTERRQAANRPFDAQPLSSAEIGDLDIDRFTQDVLPQLIADDVLLVVGRDPRGTSLGHTSSS
jgi:ATP-dependent DNA helicase RecG